MYKVKDRVIVSFQKGTVIEYNDDVRSRFPNVPKNRENEFVPVKFDGLGPNRNGFGLYHVSSYFIRKLRLNEM